MLPFFMEGSFLHEMSIAEGILDIALTEAAKNGGSRIAEVGLLIGEMSGIETEALSFCWDSLTKKTIAAGAVLKIKRIPLRGKCRKCGEEREISNYNFICECGGTLTVISGRELQVEYLEVD